MVTLRLLESVKSRRVNESVSFETGEQGGSKTVEQYCRARLEIDGEDFGEIVFSTDDLLEVVREQINQKTQNQDPEHYSESVEVPTTAGVQYSSRENTPEIEQEDVGPPPPVPQEFRQSPIRKGPVVHAPDSNIADVAAQLAAAQFAAAGRGPQPPKTTRSLT